MPLRHLSQEAVLALHADALAKAGGSAGVCDRGALESAVAQPTARFGGTDLYDGLAAKAAALGHALIANHPFVDGNKRVGHMALEAFLVVNGHELDADVDAQEAVVLAVASGEMERTRLKSGSPDTPCPYGRPDGLGHAASSVAAHQSYRAAMPIQFSSSRKNCP